MRWTVLALLAAVLAGSLLGLSQRPAHRPDRIRIDALGSPFELLDPAIALSDRGTALVFRSRHRRKTRQVIELIEIDPGGRQRGAPRLVAVADEPLSAPAVAWDGDRYLVLWTQGGALWASSVAPRGRSDSPRRLHPRARTVCGAVPIPGGWALAWSDGDTVFAGRLDRRGRRLESDDHHAATGVTGCALARSEGVVFLAWSRALPAAGEHGAHLAGYGLDGELRFRRTLAESRSIALGPVALDATERHAAAVVFARGAPALAMSSDERGALRALEPVPLAGVAVAGALAAIGRTPGAGAQLAVLDDGGHLWSHRLPADGSRPRPAELSDRAVLGSALSSAARHGVVAVAWSEGDAIFIARSRPPR